MFSQRSWRGAGLWSLGLLLVTGLAHAQMALMDVWIAEPPPGAQTVAGYLTLENSGSQSRFLESVSSPQFARVEIHRTTIVDEVARMKIQTRLEVSAGERLMFEPGGYHLMLIEPGVRLIRGAQVALSFEFDDGFILKHAAEVRRLDDPVIHHH